MGCRGHTKPYNPERGPPTLVLSGTGIEMEHSWELGVGGLAFPKRKKKKRAELHFTIYSLGFGAKQAGKHQTVMMEDGAAGRHAQDWVLEDPAAAHGAEKEDSQRLSLQLPPLASHRSEATRG